MKAKCAVLMLVFLVTSEFAGAQSNPGSQVRSVGTQADAKAAAYALIEPYLGHAMLAVVIRSVDCGACQQQIDVLERVAGSIGWPRTVIIAPDSAQRLVAYKEKRRLHAVDLISDPESSFYQYYAPEAPADMHGAFLIDANAQLLWHITGNEPLLDTDLVRSKFTASDSSARVVLTPASAIQVKGDRTKQPIIIAVWKTDDENDDYVTWAPTPCTIRLAEPHTLDMEVTLTNEPDQPPAPGRSRPSEGKVRFASNLEPGKTADQPALALHLPADGHPVEFYIAGQFGRPSASDKDCIIDVHEGTSRGPVVATHALMVRVRKNVRDLEAREKKLFLKAVYKLHLSFPNDAYWNQFVEMHVLASGRNKLNPWPDQAHIGSGFPPWHRAFGLEFERALQQVEPSVTLPYWRMDETPSIFTPDFMGANPATNEAEEDVQFAEDNPLYGWTVKLRYPNAPVLLKRGGNDHNAIPTSGDPPRPFQTEAEIMANETYRTFRASFEVNPHNVGHVWLGGRWSWSCLFPAADPVFWMFHCEIDRLWAKWQWKHSKFATSGSDESNYWPVGHFDPAGDITMGHYLLDTMWPWDGTTGFQMEGNYRSRRPDQNWFGRFPKAEIIGLWPAVPARPTPADMIDYLGLDPKRLPMGFCFDDVPFGGATLEQGNQQATPNPALERVLLRAVQDKNLSVSEQLAALRALSQSATGAVQSMLVAVAADRQAVPDLRAAAMDYLTTIQVPGAAKIGVAELTGSKDPKVRLAAARWLGYVMYFGSENPSVLRSIESIFLQALSDPDPSVERETLIAMLRMGDKTAFDRLEQILEEMLAKPDEGPLPLSVTEAISFSAGVRTEKTLGLLRAFLLSNRTDVASAAAHSLLGDTASVDKRLALVRDSKLSSQVREAALESLMRESSGLSEVALAIAKDTSEPLVLRSKAVAAFRVAVQSGASSMTGLALTDAINDLRELARSTSELRLKKSIEANLDLLDEK